MFAGCVADNAVGVRGAEGNIVAPVHEIGRVNVAVHGGRFARCPCGIVVGTPVNDIEIGSVGRVFCKRCCKK